MDEINFRQSAGGIIVPVKVVPGSSRDRISGVLDGQLKINTSAPPEKGRANKSVAAILAKHLDTSVKNIKLIRGTSSPKKEFFVAGISADEAISRLK